MDIGKKIKTGETDKPIRAPVIEPVRQPVPVTTK